MLSQLKIISEICLFCQVMCKENLQERRELIQALHKDRKVSDLPKITQVKYTYSLVPGTKVGAMLNIFSSCLACSMTRCFLDAADTNHLGRRRSGIPGGIGTQIKKVNIS